MAKNLLMGGNRYDFWKSVKRSVNSKVPLLNVIHNTSGSEKICKYWEDHYKYIFNSAPGHTVINVQYFEFDNSMLVHYDEVTSAILLTYQIEKLEDQMALLVNA